MQNKNSHKKKQFKELSESERENEWAFKRKFLLN